MVGRVVVNPLSFPFLSDFFGRENVKHTRMRSILLAHVLSSFLPMTVSLTVGILGAQGGLGREVVSQCLARGWTVHAYVRRPTDPVLTPVRRGWLSPDPNAARTARPITSERLHLFDSSDGVSGDEDSLVSVMSGSPFSNEFETVDAFRNACSGVDRSVCRVCLVSAHGVGDSIDGANMGIQVMRDWYLRGTYAAKEAQEDYLRTVWNGTYTILRPRVLSYEPIPMNPIARTRTSVANEICRWVCEQ